MAAKKKLSVSMSTRPVSAPGSAWSPYQRDLSDAGVALDWISELRPYSEALVLRVSAMGGAARERESVAGDWLCLADGSAPARLPAPDWSFGRAAMAWSQRMPWLDLWERCEVAGWMIQAADGVRVDPKLVALASIACSRHVSESLRSAGISVSLGPLDAVDAWLSGSFRGGLEGEVRAAVAATDGLARAAYIEADALATVYADTYASCVRYDEPVPDPSGDDELHEPAYALRFAVCSYLELESAATSPTAELPARAAVVRSVIDTLSVLSAAADDFGLGP